jgi:hypothetical protein
MVRESADREESGEPSTSGDGRLAAHVATGISGDMDSIAKTKWGEREVDLCESLAKMLRDFVGERTEGLLFQTSTGAQLLQSNTLSDSLHPLLRAIDHLKGGFNIFGRFRITHLQQTECPEVLRHFWSGHAQKHVFERYSKLLNERDFRLEWAEKVGLGFALPVPVGRLGFQKSPKSLKRWWTRSGSNRRPPRCERGALPAELLAHEQQLKF